MEKKRLYVGIDVDEADLEVAFHDRDNNPVRSGQRYDNTPEGIQRLRGDICAAASLVGKRPEIWVGFESTSNFHKNLERELRAARPRRMSVFVLNPRSVKMFKKMNLQVGKTDEQDARAIAHFLLKEKPAPNPEPAEGQPELQELVRMRRTLQEENTMNKNRLRRLLRQHFPGYKQALGAKLNRKTLVAFSNFASPDDILAAAPGELETASVAFRHRVGAPFAARLRKLAAAAPVQSLNPGIVFIIKSTARRILDLYDTIRILDSRIEDALDKYFPDSVLHSVPGLGRISIAAIIAETGDISRFATLEDYIGFIGLYPVRWQSGKTDFTSRMTSKGNKLLKMTFLVASAPARIYNPVIRAMYDRLRARGKSKMAAGGAIARKLAAIVYTLLKNNEQWNPDKAMRGMTISEKMIADIERKKAEMKKDGRLSGRATREEPCRPASFPVMGIVAQTRKPRKKVAVPRRR